MTDASGEPTRDLRALFEPEAIAVLGASDDPAKWGHWIAQGALRGETQRDVFLVNRRGGDVLGRRAYRSLADLPRRPELVVIAVPASAFEQAVDDALAVGARAIVAISAGLGEQGDAGRAREHAVVERVRAAGAVLLGPNCMGVFDAGAELDLSASAFPTGSIGLVSQSGNLALEIARLAADMELGLARFASLGNQADLEAHELVAALAAHDPTRVVAVYCEDFRDGRAFARAAAAAVRAGKPVLLLTAGTSDAGARAARSHTGALVSGDDAVDAACRAAGIIRVSTPLHLVDVAAACLASSRPRGRRLAVVADGGGHAAVAADCASAAGLELPALSSPLQERLRAALPDTAATANPVDLAGGGEQDLNSYADVLGAVLASGEVDAALLSGYFGGYSELSEDFRAREVAVADDLARSALASGRPLVAHSMHPASPPARALRARGVPVYRDVAGAVRALAALAEAAGRSPSAIPSAPPAPAAPGAAVRTLDYLEARALVAEAGVPVSPVQPVTTLVQAEQAAEELGYPVVLKALGLLHKSDAGGVALGLNDRDALTGSFVSMAATTNASRFALEPMADLGAGAELIVGCRRDPRFGPLVLVGIGGIHAETLADVRVALAPAGAEELERLLRELRGAALLTGARGRPPLAVAAAAAAAAGLSALAARRPELVEIEVNPLLVTPDGALALDASAIVAAGA
jgi:acyl-CoA synthetase (NDP forming)